MSSWKHQEHFGETEEQRLARENRELRAENERLKKPIVVTRGEDGDRIVMAGKKTLLLLAAMHGTDYKVWVFDLTDETKYELALSQLLTQTDIDAAAEYGVFFDGLDS